MGKHEYTTLDRARDELFSHVQRCDVLDAVEEHQKEWLEETMQFMAERYPDLTQLQLAQLEAMGRRYIRPAIPHGRGKTELSREDWKGEEPEAEGDAAEEAAEDVAEPVKELESAEPELA